MSNVSLFSASVVGKIKPMNAVNNGPLKQLPDQTNHNFEDYHLLEIPFARNHDASFCASYGGPHTVDVAEIFRDFDADPDDPASYDFVLTDEYIERTALAGTETFYRLGHRIEHEIKKYGTLPPKDFHKWAVICEHIIRHMNYGWADGHHYGLRYWEIWNEPDLDADDSDNKRNWGGTAAEFRELYAITAKHLKSCFPELLIGGPAQAYHHANAWTRAFLSEMREKQVPIDFYSWHNYSNVPSKAKGFAKEFRDALDEFGYGDTASILNEWNYMRGGGPDFVYSIRAIIGIKGAAYILASMATCQYAPVDMLMYYDLRPTCFNGVFDYYTNDRLKGFYSFLAFRDLRRLGDAFRVESDDASVYVCGATDGRKCAATVTYYNEDDSSPDQTVTLRFDRTGKAKFFLLDAEHDLTQVREEAISPDAPVTLDLKLFDTYYIEY